jgi:hypothetical protein
VLPILIHMFLDSILFWLNTQVNFLVLYTFWCRPISWYWGRQFLTFWDSVIYTWSSDYPWRKFW